MKNKLEKNQLKSGQILVIILIVMLVLGIIVVSVTNNIIRDISQSRQNTQYESLYSVSEKHVLNLAQSLPIGEVLGTEELTDEVKAILTDTSININNLETECVEDITLINRTAIICEVFDDTNPELTDSELRIRVIDSPFLENVPVAKDETVVFKIEPSIFSTGGGNSSLVTVSLGGEGINDANYNIALEVMYDFKYIDRDGDEQYSTVRVVFDKEPLLFSNLQDEFFLIKKINPNSFTFDYNADFENRIKASYLGSLVPSSSAITPVQFRFKPIIHTANPEDIPTILLNVETAPVQNIIQSRIFEATSFTVKDGEIFGAQAFVEASVPAYKIPSIFDYVLRSNGDIQHEVPAP